MDLKSLFLALADALDEDREIERRAKEELCGSADGASYEGMVQPLPQKFLDVMEAPNAHEACQAVLQTPLPWAPPQTSDSAEYIAHSRPKVHVELLGPEGLVKNDQVRLGLYGILPHSEYGIRTHPAEEVFVMLAGEADWKCGEADYICMKPGERSYHPSYAPHATRTGNLAFMSVYVWLGDLSRDRYHYAGIPNS